LRSDTTERSVLNMGPQSRMESKIICI